MANNHSTAGDRWRLGGAEQASGDEIQYLLSAERQLLHSISGGAPLSQVLDRICEALDSEIGDTNSVIALQDEDGSGLAVIAKSAILFRLYKFCSAGVVDGNGEQRGSLEMYCSDVRRPDASEVQLIERATCLAAMAIERDRHRVSAREAECAPRPRLRVLNHTQSCSTPSGSR